ncbi:MAG: mobile mystery protein B [Proteobacteria bacterium]|nr:mobile mystery protein B [Pseudomonadota bacterium]
MTDAIAHEPAGATPLDDISGLLRDDITTRGQLDEAESLNILNAVEWISGGHFDAVFTVTFYTDLHRRMYNFVWSWAGKLRSETGATPNIGVSPAAVPQELGRIAMEFSRLWARQGRDDLLMFIASYHHALVLVHPFNDGNGRWSRLACDVVVERLSQTPRLVWARDTLNTDSAERSAYIAALKQADAGNLTPLVDYLRIMNPDY